jgi:hypothetical protein
MKKFVGKITRIDKVEAQLTAKEVSLVLIQSSSELGGTVKAPNFGSHINFGLFFSQKGLLS